MQHDDHSRAPGSSQRWLAALAAAVLAGEAGLVPAAAQEGPAAAPSPDVGAAGPVELLERGRAAFDAGDLAAAESALETFIAEYGASEETREAVRLHVPLVAICKVATGKHGEALEWMERAFADPGLDARLADELRFFRGVALMTTGELEQAQHAFGAYWAVESHQPFKRYEALLLFAALYLQQEFPDVAAEFLGEQLPAMREDAPEAAGRAAVLRLYALLEAGDLDAALALVREQHPRLAEMTQVISFQTLALQLGARLLEEERWHDAIACLQRVAPRERLLAWQGERAADIERRIAALGSNPAARAMAQQLEGIQRRVAREVENFERMENFDSALRLRLASAYQAMGRYREAALVMEDMLQAMPPDPVVDAASQALAQCWMEVKRWPKAVEAADLYQERFGEAGLHFPAVRFLKAEALREDLRWAEAQLAYGDLAEAYPGDPVAPKAIFMQGFLYLLQDDNEGALFQFDQVFKKHPESALNDDAAYWSGMALSFSKDYEAARDYMRGYLEEFSQGGGAPRYQEEAVFRVAACTFSLGEYPESIVLLEEFIARDPEGPLADEARLLLGDALFAEGEIERGIAAYAAIRPESTRYHEDAWFKTGNALKLTEEHGKMRDHFERFVRLYPESSRMPEAIYWLGWIDTQEGRPDKAQAAYWDAIALHGNRPELRSMEDLFLALPKAYASQEDGEAELLAKLEEMLQLAESGRRDTLALRCAWARARLLERSDAARGRAALLAAAALANPRLHHPRITVDIADAQREAGLLLLAKELYAETRRWHPRAVEKDRIYAGLGRIAEAEGETEDALAYYQRFERETAMAAGLAEIRLAKARLLAEKGRAAEARETLEALLEDPGSSPGEKAAALVELGDLLAGAGDLMQALPYYERVYVAYGKFGELNARAYARRARALESLGMGEQALEVYRELAGREDLKTWEEARLAAEKLSRAGEGAETGAKAEPGGEKGGQP